MKKFLVFFMVMFGIACSAMAGYQGEQPDIAKGGDGKCVFMADNVNQHYAVYFRTGEDSVSNGCKSDFDSVKSELEELWNGGDVAYFVLVASADTQGDGKGYDNVDLSMRRFNYVVENILPSDAHQENKGWITGSATDQKFDPEYGEKWQYRGVYIYPMWARSLCTADKISKWEANLKMLTDASKRYPDSDSIKKLIANYEDVLKICNMPDKILGRNDTDKLLDLLSNSMVLIENVNTQYNIGLEQTTVVNTEISKYYSRLAEIRAGLKLSAWRDAEGKFNTARLASDSIAGVVLGTVGGIVTSKLVKKNQLKKGFEDLSCNVGGQKVADYGDTFSVGMY